MKHLIRYATAGVILSPLLFANCKKQIDDAVMPQAQAQSSTSVTACKPTAYGMYNTSTGKWTNIVQKWYDNNKVQYIQTCFSGARSSAQLFHSEPNLYIKWGEVTYEGDQVRVRDVANNRLVFRVTLDASGKPVASYLYDYLNDGWNHIFIDTSYYNYSGGRLNSIFQLFESKLNDAVTSRGWEQYTFAYNGAGSVASYFTKNENVSTDFQYSSTPVSGMLGDYVVTTSFRFMEFLELIKLPMNNTLYSVSMTRFHPRYLPFKFYERNFYNYYLEDGLVCSYIWPFSSYYEAYYTGWDCGTNPAKAVGSNDIIMSLDQFKKQYPVAK